MRDQPLPDFPLAATVDSGGDRVRTPRRASQAVGELGEQLVSQPMDDFAVAIRRQSAIDTKAQILCQQVLIPRRHHLDAHLALREQQRQH